MDSIHSQGRFNSRNTNTLKFKIPEFRQSWTASAGVKKTYRVKRKEILNRPHILRHSFPQ